MLGYRLQDENAVPEYCELFDQRNLARQKDREAHPHHLVYCLDYRFCKLVDLRHNNNSLHKLRAVGGLVGHYIRIHFSSICIYDGYCDRLFQNLYGNH